MGRNVLALDLNILTHWLEVAWGKSDFEMNTKMDPKVRQLKPVVTYALTYSAGSFKGSLNCTPHGCHILSMKKQMRKMEEEVLGRKRVKAVAITLYFSKRERILPFL